VLGVTPSGIVAAAVGMREEGGPGGMHATKVSGRRQSAIQRQRAKLPDGPPSPIRKQQC
jgi:hypothetical protein